MIFSLDSPPSRRMTREEAENDERRSENDESKVEINENEATMAEGLEMSLWQIFISAIALVLVIEGMLPFLSPRLWKRSMIRLIEQSDKSVRIVGLCSMLIGLIILIIIHQYN